MGRRGGERRERHHDERGGERRKADAGGEEGLDEEVVSVDRAACHPWRVFRLVCRGLGYLALEDDGAWACAKRRMEWQVMTWRQSREFGCVDAAGRI
jgi:hypothetical protein